MKSYFNSLANLAGNIASIGISILLVPLYIKFLGVEAFGLVGFFTTISAYFAILDFGLLPSLTIKMSSHLSGECTRDDAIGVLSSIEKLFFMIVAGALLVWVLIANWIAISWFKDNSLATNDLRIALLMMGATVVTKLIGNVYRNALIGLTDQIYLNFSTTIFSISRGVIVVSALAISPNIVTFFLVQLVTSFFEILFLRLRVCRKLSANWFMPAGNFKNLRTLYKIGMLNAVCSLLWVSLTQVDKLILSKELSLREFGEISISLAIVNILPVFSSSISQAFTPEFVAWRGPTSERQFAATFLKVLTLTLLAMWPVVSIINAFSNEIIWAWAGTKDVFASKYLPYYATAQCFVGINAILYGVQFAKNNISLHFKINIFFSIASIPILWWATKRFGATGASIAWLCTNFCYTLCVTPIVLKKFIPGVLIKNLFLPLVSIPAVSLASAFVIRNFHLVDSSTRLITFLILSISGIIVGLCTWIFSSRIGLIKSPIELLALLTVRVRSMKTKEGKSNGY